jgi:hypothetical protein
VREIFQTYGLSAEECATVVESFRRRPKDWVAFIMRFELGLEQPDPSRAWKSALTIAFAYIVGGVIPLSAYLFLSDVYSALRLSVVVTLTSPNDAPPSWLWVLSTVDQSGFPQSRWMATMSFDFGKGERASPRFSRGR